MTANELIWEVGAGTETGYVRNENQDRMSAVTVPLGQIYIIADGMGGHVGGAQAAELTIKSLENYFASAQKIEQLDSIFGDAFTKTNKEVYDKAHAGNPLTEGMGTTAVLLLLANGIAKFAHVGDSRAYLYRNGTLQQITKDHTQVQRMVDAGMLTMEEARIHPESSVLDRAIGHMPTVEVDISSDLELKEQDAILLCSDGLCGYAGDSEIKAVLDKSLAPQETVDQLIDMALKKGGEDNVTVQLISVSTNSQKRRYWLVKMAWMGVLAMLLSGFIYVFYKHSSDVDKPKPSPGEQKQLIQENGGQTKIPAIQIPSPKQVSTDAKPDVVDPEEQKQSTQENGGQAKQPKNETPEPDPTDAKPFSKNDKPLTKSSMESSNEKQLP